MRKEKGITLIALIITIIILIILAGVAINISVGENGLLNKAKEAKEKYTVETIREKVEIGIINLEVEEIALGNEVTIDLVLQKLLEDRTFETIDKDEDIGNIGEYEVKLKYNEEGKVVIEYIEKATGVRVTYTLKPVGYTNGDKVSILLTVKGKVKSVIKPDGLIIYPENEVLAIDYEVTANGTYIFTIEDEEGSIQEKNVIVDTIDRLAPNDFEITGENTGTGIKITANATDAESDGISVKSGIEKYEYFVKGESDTDFTKYETKKTTEILELTDGTYSIYVITYDRAGNKKTSNTIIITQKRLLDSRRYVDYGIDLNSDGDTTNDWMIFYEEENETSEYYGATYIIPSYYVPYKKMKSAISKAGMELYSDSTYIVKWATAPSTFTKRDNYEEVKEIFMYDYTGETRVNVMAVSKLLDTTVWESDFVTEELKAKGGMAIGGPTINMWCASWNKEYPEEKIVSTIYKAGYQLNEVQDLNISSLKGYKTDVPNVYWPTNSVESDETEGYWIASPSSHSGYDCLIVTRHSGLLRASNYNSSSYHSGLRPLVYLPSSIKLEESGTPNLYNINYGD